MEIKFKTKEFLAALTQSSAVVMSKNSMPILDNVMIETRDDGNGGVLAVLLTSDSDMWLQMKTPLLGGDKDIKFCIGASDFLKALKNLDDCIVTMTLDKDKHVVTCEYGNGHFSLPFIDTNEFPKPYNKEGEMVTRIMDREKVLCAIESVEYAIANDMLRPVMNGVHFDFFKDRMVSAATDGHKLSKYTDNSITHEEEIVYQFTLAQKPCAIIKNILSSLSGDVKISFNDGMVEMNNTHFKLTSRLIEGRYPHYDSVIPKESKALVSVDKQKIITALKRVIPMGNATSELMSLHLSTGKLTLNTEDIDFSKSASECVDCEYNGDDMLVGFKSSSLLQILSNVPSEVVHISLIDPTRAVIFYGDDKDTYLSLLMPMILH